MILDIRTHYLPLESLAPASEIGGQHERYARGRDFVKRDGKAILARCKLLVI